MKRQLAKALLFWLAICGLATGAEAGVTRHALKPALKIAWQPLRHPLRDIKAAGRAAEAVLY